MKYLLPILAALFAWNACAAIEGPRHEEKMETRSALIPRVRYKPLTCKTHTKEVGCNTCEWSECTNGKLIWSDDLMRCTARDCTERPSLEDWHELDGHMLSTKVSDPLPAPAHANADQEDE